MSEDARRKKGEAETPSDSSAVATDGREFGEFSPTGQGLDRLMQEINILRLESSFFCFDKKQARKRTEPTTIPQRNTRAIVVEMHPIYDQPTLLAYKVMQAHELAGHEHNIFDGKETAYATHLVKEHKRGIEGSVGHRPLHARLASCGAPSHGRAPAVTPRHHR